MRPLPLPVPLRALLLALSMLLAGCAGDAWRSTVALTTAQAVLQPEGGPAVTREVALRYRWDAEFPGRGGRAVYRIALPPRPAGDAAAALWFPLLGNQAEVRINGALVQRLGVLGDPRTDHGKQGRAVIVPDGLLRPGAGNELRIDATIQPLRLGGLGRVFYGPAAAVEALISAQVLQEQSLLVAYVVCLALIGGLALGLWWRQRDPLYGTFGLAALFGAVRPLDHVWHDVPVPWPLWGALVAICYGAQLGLLARFVLLVVGVQSRWLVRAVHATMVAAVVLPALSFALRAPALWTAALVLLELVGLACFVAVAREAARPGKVLARVLLAAGGLLILAGVHDTLFVRLALHPGVFTEMTPHATFLFVLLLAGLTVNRHNRAVADFRALNDQLAQRVQERERQLREAFEALRAQQQEQAVHGERQRIMREIHDGVGSQLVGVLSMLGRPQPDRAAIETHVKQALDEMRMAVDSLQPVHGDLTTVLATLRYRLQPRLEAAGIDIDWDVPPLPPIPQLASHAVLQVQRILLEAFTNVLRHARATRVSVQARWIEAATPQGVPAVVLRLCDDGRGFGARAAEAAGAGAGAGHGLSNMRARAAGIGASIRFEDAAGGGACVMLVWPLVPPGTGRGGGSAGQAAAAVIAAAAVASRPASSSTEQTLPEEP